MEFFCVVNLWKKLNVEYGKIISKNKGVLIVKKAVQKIIDVFQCEIEFEVLIMMVLMIFEVVNIVFLKYFIPIWSFAILAISGMILLVLYVYIIAKTVKEFFVKMEKQNQKEIHLISCVQSNISSKIEQMDENIVANIEKEGEECARNIRDLSKNSREYMQKLIDNVKQSKIEVIDAINDTNKNLHNVSTREIKESIGILQNSIEKRICELKEEEIASKKSIIRDIGLMGENNQEEFEKVEANINNIENLVVGTREQTEKQIDSQKIELMADIRNVKDSLENSSKKNIASFCEEIQKAILNKSNEGLAACNNISEMIQKLQNLFEKKTNALQKLENDHRDIIISKINSSNVIYQEELDNKVRVVMNDVNTLERTMTSRLSESNDVILSQLKQNAEYIADYQTENVKKFKETILSQKHNREELSKQASLLSTGIGDVKNTLEELSAGIKRNKESINIEGDSVCKKMFSQMAKLSDSIMDRLIKLQNEFETKEEKGNLFVVNNQNKSADAIREEINKSNRDNYLHQLEMQAVLDNVSKQINTLVLLGKMLENVPIVPINSDDSGEKNSHVQKIVDVENDSVLYNHYQNNRLTLSEMLSDDKKKYDISYGPSGEVLRTRNYGEDGSVITELTFYPNGQVKKRKEKLNIEGKKKMVISKFDEYGNKQEG